MSSFIVSNECMSNVINGLYWNHGFKEMYRHQIHKKMNLDNYDKDSDLAYQDFGNKLFELNQKAVMARYPEDKTNYAQIHKFEWKDRSVSDLQFLKSVQCLMYQCSEGDVPNTELYKWLEVLERCLMAHIINKMPEYNQAAWS